MGSSTNNIEDIFIKNIVNRKVKLEPIHIHKDYKDELNKKLVKELDGKYSKYGFIKEGSISIIKCSLGELEQNSLQGNVLFNVQFDDTYFITLIYYIILALYQLEIYKT